MTRWWLGVILAVSAVLGAACSSEPVPAIPPGCNPISLDSCYLPYPSAFYQVADPSTPTGVRMQWPAQFLPDSDGVPFDPRRLVDADGASPAAPIVVFFKEGIDLAGLPTIHAMEESVAATSKVVLVDEAGTRVPFFVELDANSVGDAVADQRALVIRPLHRLEPATRYVVAIRGDVRNQAGGALLAPQPFRTLRDQRSTGRTAVKALVDHYEQVFAILAGVGVGRGEIVLAWDFVTASEESITAPLLAMRDDALARVAAGGYGYTIDAVKENPDARLLRQVTGTFEAPWYLEGTGATAALAFGADGKPAFQGVGTAPFAVNVPQCAATATGPLRVIVFGHGIFGTGEGEIDSDYHHSLANELCAIEIAGNWLGLSRDDRATTVPQVLLDLSQVYIVTDKLMQAQVNFQVLARLVRGALKDDAVLTREGTVGGTAITDASEVYYYGCSNGAIQGSAFMALSPDVERGVLNVGGGPWTQLMQRSTAFSILAAAFVILYPNNADQQLIFAVWQSYWDAVDPVTWAAHSVRAPLPGAPAKRILVQEAIGDATVPNIGTRYLARTLGVTGLGPLVDPPFDVPVAAGPLASGYSQWDTEPSPLPDDVNIPPQDNPAHSSVRKLPDLVRQLDAFFRPDGEVTQTCPASGCVYPGFK
ncbi:MAG: hypothetical protein HY906_18890 [Deltaproteobacteria bacterium]|nr:hypothetical protein [Deltaproteobacteria bacterium]